MSVDNFFAMAQVGSKETVKAGLEALIAKYDVDEFIFTCDIYDTEKRLHNFELLMQIKTGNNAVLLCLIYSDLYTHS